jgi:hypothetical protein
MIENMMLLYQAWKEASLYMQIYSLCLVFSLPLIFILMGLIEKITNKKGKRTFSGR